MAVAYSTKAEPSFAGKPRDPMLSVVRRRAPHAEIMVGDQPTTDGALAERLGIPFALVHSGVTPCDHGPLDVPVALEVASLIEVVDAMLVGTTNKDEA